MLDLRYQIHKLSDLEIFHTERKQMGDLGAKYKTMDTDSSRDMETKISE